uniref:Uncharacterized protein n=1 Tax=Anopheles arabiensis TaxID=7173 RepID=A0A182HN08_ANOAR
MNRDEERSLSVSPPLTGQRQQHHLAMSFQHTPSLYGGFHPATASAMGMLAPQLLAANQTAAALMAAGLPMSLRASLATGLFPPHAALFGAWAPPTPTSNNSSPPPPQSPISPALSHKSSKSLKLSVANNNNNSSSTNNNHIVSTTSEIVPQTKKLTKRKHQASLRKELSAAAAQHHQHQQHQHHHHHLQHLMRSPSHSHHLSMPVDIPVSPGPISPPTSGSSPQSNGSCGLPSPPTPAVSPAASGDQLSDHAKSVCGGSESSDLSLDRLTKIPTPPGMLLHHKFPGLTLPLSFGPLPAGDGAKPDAASAMDLRATSRSRTPQQIVHIKSELPEQTEPEDLSMHSPRSPVSMEELDELDDAATLYLKQRQQLLQQQNSTATGWSCKAEHSREA